MIQHVMVVTKNRLAFVGCIDTTNLEDESRWLHITGAHSVSGTGTYEHWAAFGYPEAARIRAIGAVVLSKDNVQGILQVHESWTQQPVTEDKAESEVDA